MFSTTDNYQTQGEDDTDFEFVEVTGLVLDGQEQGSQHAQEDVAVDPIGPNTLTIPPTPATPAVNTLIPRTPTIPSTQTTRGNQVIIM